MDRPRPTPGAELRRLAGENARLREKNALLAARVEALEKAAASGLVPRAPEEPPRVGLFVDVQNMYYAARQLGARLDFGALVETVSRDRRMVRAVAYVIQNRDVDQTGFLSMLHQRGYDVRRKDLKVRADGSSKGDWDIGMALDILGLAASLDVIVLATGDGDFAPLVREVKARGPRVEVYSFGSSTARELIEAADGHVEITSDLLIHADPAT